MLGGAARQQLPPAALYITLCSLAFVPKVVPPSGGGAHSDYGRTHCMAARHDEEAIEASIQCGCGIEFGDLFAPTETSTLRRFTEVKLTRLGLVPRSWPRR